MKYDNVANIIILGNGYSGKTTLIYNYLYKTKDISKVPPTIGVDHYKYSFQRNNKNNLLKIWDSGSGLLYRNILDYYFHCSDIFLIIEDKRDSQFIKKVLDIIAGEKKVNPQYVIIIFNKKTDYDKMNNFYFNETELKNYYKMVNILFFYINAHNRDDVEDVFNSIKNIVVNDITQDLIPLNLNIENEYKKNKNKLCNIIDCCTIS